MDAEQGKAPMKEKSSEIMQTGEGIAILSEGLLMPSPEF